MVNPLSGLEEFLSIVEEGSLSAAAKRLGVPRTTLSRKLRELEASVGVALVELSTRRLSLTRAGALLYRRGRPLLATTRALRDEVAQLDGIPRGLLRVSIPSGPEPWKDDLIGAFMAAYPEVRIELIATGRPVELHVEEVDVVIRAGDAVDEGLVGRVLVASSLICVASKDYLARRPLPSCVEQMTEHECALWITPNLSPSRQWPLYAGGSVPVDGRFASSSVWHLARHVARGHAIGLLPHQTVEGGLQSGDLVPVLEGIIGVDSVIRVLYASRRYALPAVQHFVEHTVQWYAARSFDAFEDGALES